MVTKKEQFKNILAKYIPEEFLEYTIQLFIKHPVKFKISKPRRTKLGDFRANKEGLHQITVNGDLNRYSFLITTIHEFAHLITFDSFGWKVKPHGNEWQMTYRKLMTPIVDSTHLPSDVSIALRNSLINVKASSCTDKNLQRVLMNYNKTSHLIALENLDKNAIFTLSNKVFKKGVLRRSRFECSEVKTNKKYLINCLAMVNEINYEK
jgi:SprT protein